ncbi:extracellular solute-binding protein [Terrarubrum flagellatum]|uniref:extracellular solute-binding protein n=1 Tax=Terrirubrum flagellatum TaxID=2895980 RepID=UPI0031457052
MLLGAGLSVSAKAEEISLWSWRQEDRAAYAKILDAFHKKNPDITVKFEAFEPTTYATVLSTALAAGTGPDVVQVRAYGNLESVAKPGYLLPLDKTNMPGLANFADSALAAETMRSDGKVYAVPFASQTMLVIYNAETFEKNGVKPPATWDEFIELCKALKAKGVTPLGNGVATAWQNETIVSALLSSLIGKQFEADVLSGKADFTDPRFVSALARLDGVKDYFAPNFSGVDYAASQQLFASGRAAMFAGGSFELATFLKLNPKLKLGVFPSPAATANDERLVALYYDGGFAVNAKSAKQQAALKLVNFMSSAEFGTMFANALQNISPINGVAFESPLLQEVATLNKKSMSYLMLVHFRYQEPSGSVLLQAGVQKMLAGKATPAEIGAEVTKGIAAYFPPFKK